MTPTPTEIADNLLPCPFPHLGKELLHGSWPAKHQFWIHCPCGAMGPHADSPEKAIAAWNRRATSRDHRAAAEEINAYLWTHHGISLSKDTYQQLTAIIAKHAGVRPEISRALGGAVGDRYAEGYAAAREDALAAEPSTAENPNEDSYQRGRFDGIMEYATALSALKPQDGEE